jgi:hypothetical protein
VLWIVLILILVAVAIVVVMAIRQSSKCDGFVFDKQEYLCTPAERALLRTMEQVLDCRYRVFAKVSLSAVVRPSSGMQPDKLALAEGLMNCTVLDFVICAVADCAVVGVVSLTVPGLDRAEERNKDDFVDQALTLGNIPVVYFSPEKSYAAGEVRTRLDECFALHSVVVADHNGPAVQRAVVPDCPHCAAPMIKRHAEKGPHAGRAFWACAAYPRCRHLMALDETS